MTFNIGDSVWVARAGSTQVTKPCFVCHTKKEVTLILGNGDEVGLPCDYCARGYERPSGYIQEYEYVAEPERHTISRIETRQEGSKTEVTYYGGSYVLYENIVFATREESLAKCEELAQKYEKEQSERIDRIKKNVHKSYSWNAGYHMRQVKDHKKQIEYHESMAKICKERAEK